MTVFAVVAVVAAAALTTTAAALARAAGVGLEVPDGGETIPLAGIAVVTAFCSAVGVALAAALGRWSAQPTRWFVRVTLGLTAISLAPPFLVDASAGTSVALAGLHVLAAAVVIPTLARSLRLRSARR
ncbi:DUF6069 family protein [Pimelobacter simplex]|uniref:DUF6069 family protein n=1 Tax=Nocardioides simplex TaxID=2045 RepID=UPI003AAF62FE